MVNTCWNKHLLIIWQKTNIIYATVCFYVICHINKETTLLFLTSHICFTCPTTISTIIFLCALFPPSKIAMLLEPTGLVRPSRDPLAFWELLLSTLINRPLLQTLKITIIKPTGLILSNIRITHLLAEIYWCLSVIITTEVVATVL